MLRSSEVYFDAENPLSHTLSAARMHGPDTELELWGYGADVEHEKIRPPLVKGSWWYPRDIYWRVQGAFGGNEFGMGWPPEQPVERFRKVVSE